MQKKYKILRTGRPLTDNEEKGLIIMLSQLEELTDQSVSLVSFKDAGKDLIIDFDKGLVVKVFSTGLVRWFKPSSSSLTTEDQYGQG